VGFNSGRRAGGDRIPHIFVMAMAQPKAQAPFIPGQKEAADLVPDEEESRSSSRSRSITGSNSSGIPGKFIRFFGNHSSDGKEQGDGGDAGRESKLQGDYYSPVRTELVSKGGADAVKDLYYSPGAAVGIVTSELKLPPSKFLPSLLCLSNSTDSRLKRTASVHEILFMRASS